MGAQDASHGCYFPRWHELETADEAQTLTDTNRLLAAPAAAD